MEDFADYVDAVSQLNLHAAPGNADSGAFGDDKVHPTELGRRIARLEREHPDFRGQYGKLVVRAHEATRGEPGAAEAPLADRLVSARNWMLTVGLAEVVEQN